MSIRRNCLRVETQDKRKFHFLQLCLAKNKVLSLSQHPVLVLEVLYQPIWQKQSLLHSEGPGQHRFLQQLRPVVWLQHNVTSSNPKIYNEADVNTNFSVYFSQVKLYRSFIQTTWGLMGGIESFFFLPRKLFLVSFRLVSHFDQCPQRAPCWLILCQFKFPVDAKVKWFL